MAEMAGGEGGGKLRSCIERIERLNEEKRGIGADITAIYAEAKAAGFVPKVMRGVIKRRAERPNDVAEYEALYDTYLAALGMAIEAPLFTQVGLMGVDVAARESVIEALKSLVPKEGEIIVKVGAPVRLWRDADGKVRVEDFVEARAAPDAPAGKAPAARRAPVDLPPEVRDATSQEAVELGRRAARENKPVISNQFGYGDSRRARWDEGWRQASGSDGMGPAEDQAPPDDQAPPGGKP